MGRPLKTSSRRRTTASYGLPHVEHSKVIPIDLSSSHQVPSGPMTRARARALKTEVTSLLLQLPFHMRHGYYLKQRHFAYSGTKELAMEKLRSKEDRKRRTYAKTEKRKGKTAKARMIQTVVRTIQPQPG
ncbi:hypothetical protein VPH35_083855 [Triticum aestivum]